MSRRASRRQEEPPSPGRVGRWGVALSALLGISLLAYVVFYTGSLSTSVEPPTPDLRMAMARLGEARLDEAEEILRTVLRQTPESRTARDEMRWIYFNQFRTLEVQAILEDGLRRFPDDLSLAMDLLMSEFRPQNPRESVRYWERIEQRRPGQVSVYAALGYCYWKLGRIEDARRAIQTALDSRPEDFRLQLLAAEFLIDSGSPNAADQLLNSLTEQVTSDATQKVPPISWDSPVWVYGDRVWWLKSLRAEAANDIPLSLEHLERAIVRRPHEISYLQRRGALLLQLGLKREAAECFAAANELEGYMGRLTEVVLGDGLQHLTKEQCRELAETCRKRGKLVQADAWQRAAQSAER